MADCEGDDILVSLVMGVLVREGTRQRVREIAGDGWLFGDD
jgi:hypothetical protein